MKTIVLIFLFLPLAGYSQKTSRLNAQEIDRMVDTLQYGKADYDSVMSILKRDTLLMQHIESQIAKGDTNAVKAKKLLYTPYENRLGAGVSEEEINILIFATITSEKIKRRFMELDKSLEEINPKTVSESDSLTQEIEKVIQESDKRKKK